MIPKPLKERLIASALVVTLLLNVGFIAAAPQPVYAQLATFNPDIVALMQVDEVKTTVLNAIKQALIAALTTAVLNLLSYMANKFAYESAIWIASGGNAGHPLYNSLPTQDYMDNLAADVVFNVYNDLVAKNIDGGILPDFGVYLTDDKDVLQAMRLGLRSQVEGAIPEADDYLEATANFEGYLATLSLDTEATVEEKTVAVLTIVAEGFNPQVNEIGAGLQVQLATQQQALDESQTIAEENTKSDGFQPVKDPITGKKFTPASFVSAELFDSLFSAKKLPTELSTALLGNSDALIAIGTSATSIFTNTLLTSLMDRWRGGLLKETAYDPTFSSGYDPFDADSTLTTDSQRIAESFSSILSFRPLSISNYSLLSELSTCPATFRGSQPGLFNCVIDTSFASAVARSDAGSPLTLSEAIEEGYIHGDWPLIPSSDTARNQDTNCYTYGFCHSNLVKMRRARLISTGWELAAQSDANSANDPVTLQEVMDGFYQCNSDNERDDEHPWCHLIDPDWVLKFPDTQCRTLAYGQLLKSSGVADRQEECVDIQSCVQEDAYGNCTGGYGYCVREKNTWRFRGDECPEQYASCLSFTDVDGTAVDLLTNTLDYGDCSESNTGCLWYSTVKVVNDDDEYDWPEIPNVESADEDQDAYQERIYFNANVQECDEDGAGCAQVIERDENLSLNLITNGSFEVDDDGDAWPDGWILNGAVYNNTDDVGRTGDAAMSPGTSGMFYKYGTVLQQSRFYTFSFYAAQASETASNGASMNLWLTDEDGDQIELSGTSYQGDCDINDLDSDGIYETIEIDDATGVPESTSYERFECTFSTPVLSDKTLDIYAIVNFGGSSIWIDDVQLEQSEDASSYHAGYSESSVSYDSVKLPPTYLGCTGAFSDPEECDSYAGICTEQEAGCTLYTPTNGDPSVSAVTNELDECPSVCAGYDTFRQEETLYEPDGAFPVYFIPSTAQECSAEAVGCDEFTNLETEEKEYFTYLRACVTEDQADDSDGGATFYTWEGSDEEGFQLKTWNLLESDLDGYASITHVESGEVDNVPGAAPCTNWQVEAGGETIECIDDADGAAPYLDSDTADCDEHDDIIDNPDCREFYDVNGEIHFRQWSKTVSVNDACVAYRKTDTVGDDATQQEDNCENSGGFWDGDQGWCRYFGYNEESITCAQSEAGCRNYTGGRSGNSRVAFKDVFESGTLEDWEAASASSVEISNESVATDGHSMKSDGVDVWTYLYEESGGCATDGGCDSTASALGGECTVDNGETYCGTLHNQLFTGKTYTLSFWAKGDTNLNVGFDIGFDASSIAIDASFEASDIELESGWRQYSVGPLDMNEDDYEDFGNGTALVFSPVTSGSTFYIDNVTLREGEDNITVIKDSWVTPATCDETLDGTVSAQYHLGCQEYTDQEFNTVYLKSFSKLCDEDKVGCKAYYRTYQSEDPGITIYNATCYNVDAEQTCDLGLCSDSRDSCSSDADCNTSTWEEGTTADERTNCYLFTDTSGQEFDEDSPVMCTIIAGDNSCQFNFEDWFIPEYLLDTEPELFHIDYGPDATVVEADRDIYAVVTDEYRCNSADNGCEELGKPTFSSDLSAVDSWESVYLLNDPDSYDDTLCSSEELFCAQWDAGSEGTWYFKNPGGHVCEYKTDITVDGKVYNGWFQDGTSEFCYGTGTCSDDESGVVESCSTDADCYVSGTSYGECEINSGSYLIGGTYSGIWRNGDDDYDGWVGQCTPQYSGCAEFQDRLDFDDDEFYGETDGESYYFIDNSSLDESNLLASQQCNGQVSQKFGCALFNDTSDTGVDYNASATYISSARADELHGDRAFALVDPIDCDSSATSTIITPSGDEVDLCARRCVYYNEDLDSDFDPSTDADDVYDLVTYGGSCYDDTDCANYESDTGDLVDGACVTEIVDPDGRLATDDVDRLNNDSNRVLKVTRDRTCSEWLACSSSYTVWDENAGKYQTICDGIDLCTEYSGSSSASLCSQWDPNDPAVVFDIDRYVGRDVSWYGEEYAGYAVPDIFPIQHLTQVDTAPPVGFCDMSKDYDEGDSEYDNYHGEACDDDSDCQSSGGEGEYNYCIVSSDADYQIGYSAGGCSENYAEDCVVGYCETSGSACSSSDDCEDSDDECITGVCYNISTTTCEGDDDCSSTQECLAGSCVEETGNCDLDFACEDSASTCFGSAAAKTGSCFSGICFVAINGNQFDEEVTEGMVCRAQPESDAPFTQDVVTEWKYLDFMGAEGGDVDDVTLATTDSIDLTTISGGILAGELGTDSREGGALPSQTRAGFDGAYVCAPGEPCECEYVKVASQASDPQFVAYGTDLDDIPITGICSADSPVAGALCGDDDDCRYYNKSLTDGDDISVGYVGTCQPFTSEQTFVGMKGYCLERDTGLNINGDPDLGACLTWFPVDQIAGATDLYAKYKKAGYYEDTYVCADTRPIVNLYPSNIAGNSNYDNDSGNDNGGIACAESDEGVSQNDSYDNLTGNDGEAGCYTRAYCPDGYFSIVGQPSPRTSWDYGYAGDCVESGGDNDCPYICVPINSVHETGDDAGEQCEPPTASEFGGHVAGNSSSNEYTWASGTGDYGDESDWQVGLEAFNTVVDSYNDCVLKGVEFEEVQDMLESYDYSSDGGRDRNSYCEADSSGSGSSGGYRCLWLNWEVYPACEELIQVASGSESYAFTDTLYQGSVSSEVAFGYSNDTVPAFGFASKEPADIDDHVPVRVASCTDEAYDVRLDVTENAVRKQNDNYQKYPKTIAACTDSVADTAVDLEEDGAQDPGGTPEARTFIKYEWGGLYTSEWDWNTQSEDKSNLFERINNLFAKLDLDGDTLFTWSSDNWDSETGSPTSGSFFYYDETQWGDGDDSWDNDYGDDDWEYSDEIDVRADMGEPPTVWAVDTKNCGPKYCEEGEENAITVNNTNEGNIEADGGYYRANVKFYAAADKNQLPIRRVIVDWGDGSSSGSSDPDNYYKNHRGLQDEEEDGVETQTQSKCDLEDEWGKTADSCDPNYFNYSHVYRCWAPEKLDTCIEAEDGNLTNSPCTDDFARCVFQPRVHVRDNWGWCTGTCSETNSADTLVVTSSGCFDVYADSLKNPSSDQSECAYEIYPDVDPDVDPWVYYDGYIYVDP